MALIFWGVKGLLLLHYMPLLKKKMADIIRILRNAIKEKWRGMRSEHDEDVTEAAEAWPVQQSEDLYNTAITSLKDTGEQCNGHHMEN